MRSESDSSRRSGFTLIELVVASAIAAVLIGAVFQVMVAMLADRHRLAVSLQHEPDAADAALVATLRNDLAGAGALMTDANGQLNLTASTQDPIRPTDNQASPTMNRTSLTIQTTHALDPKTLRPVDRPVTVRYVLQQVGNHMVLLREQTFADEAVPGKPWREILAMGVTHLSLQVLSDNEDLTQPTPARGATTAQPNPQITGESSSMKEQTPTLPQQVRLYIVFNSGHAPIDRVLWLH